MTPCAKAFLPRYSRTRNSTSSAVTHLALALELVYSVLMERARRTEEMRPAMTEASGQLGTKTAARSRGWKSGRVRTSEVPVPDRTGRRVGQLGWVELHQRQLGGRGGPAGTCRPACAGHSGMRPVQADLAELVDGRQGRDAAEGAGDVLAMVGRGEVHLVQGVGELAQGRLALGEPPPLGRGLTPRRVVLRDLLLLFLLLLLVVLGGGGVAGSIHAFAHACYR